MLKASTSPKEEKRPEAKPATLQDLILMSKEDIRNTPISRENLQTLMTELRVLHNATSACLNFSSLNTAQILKILHLFANKIDSSKPLHAPTPFIYQSNTYSPYMISVHGIDSINQMQEPRLTFSYDQKTETFILTSYHSSDHSLEGHLSAHQAGIEKAKECKPDDLFSFEKTIDKRIILPPDEQPITPTRAEKTTLDERADELQTKLSAFSDKSDLKLLTEDLNKITKRLASRKNTPCSIHFILSAIKFLNAIDQPLKKRLGLLIILLN